MISNYSRQTGIALVQVLLITGVISILLLSMVKLSQQQLNQVVAVQEQISNDFLQYSTLNRLKLELLSTNEFSDEQIAQGWNVYGKPFEYNGYTVTLQDLGSLVSANSNISELSKLLVSQGITANRAARLQQDVEAWQQDNAVAQSSSGAAIPLPFQHASELQHIGDWTRRDVLAIEPYLHVYSTGILNPLFLPEGALGIIASTAEADLIGALREEKNYTKRSFSQITGIQPDEFMPMSKSDFYRIQVLSDSGSVLTVDVTVRPYDNTPIKTYVSYRAIPGQRTTDEQ